MKRPCKDCSDRKFKCHVTCEKYAEFVEKNEQVKHARRLDSEIELFSIGQTERRHKQSRTGRR